MGCGMSRGACAHDRRAYHGVAVAIPVQSQGAGNRSLAVSDISQEKRLGSIAKLNVGKKPHDGFNFGVNEALQRQMRRQRVADWRKATLGIARDARRRPAQTPRYDHLTKFGACQLTMVDELSTCLPASEATLSDGATRSTRSGLSSLSTSGCTVYVNQQLSARGAAVHTPTSPPSPLRVVEASLLRFPTTAEQQGGSTGENGSPKALGSWIHPAAPPRTPFQTTPQPLRRYTLRPCSNGHAHRVKLALLAPQGDVLLSCSTVDRHVTAYHVALGTEIGRLVGHDDVLLGGAVRCDGRLVATASRDSTVILWELPSCKQRRSLPHPQPVHACQFSASGTELATACADGVCRVWTWSDCDVVNALVSPATGFAGALTSIAYTRGDRHVLAGGAAQAVFVWDRQCFSEPAAVFRQHSSAVLSVGASHTQPSLVMSSDEQTVLLWNCQTMAVLHRLDVSHYCVRPPLPARRRRKAKAATADSTAAPAHMLYWTTVQLVDSCCGLLVAAAASDKNVHLIKVGVAAPTCGNPSAPPAPAEEVLSLPFTSTLSSISAGAGNLFAFGDTCGNRYTLDLQ